MRSIVLRLLLVVSLPLFGQSVELIAPPAIGEDLTATWTVVLTNTGGEVLPARELSAFFIASLASVDLVSLPPGCEKPYPGLAVCSVGPLAPGETRGFAFTVRYDRRYGLFTGGATFSSIERRVELLFPREFPVTNTKDDGAGSLRQALLDMNQTCAGLQDPCAPVFRIDEPVPAEGWFTIRPVSPLPPITATVVFIDGRSQTRHTGDTNPAGPEIMLDGSSAWNHGLQFNGTRGTFTDLAIGNFPGHGIASRGAVTTNIHRCHLGMDPSGAGRAPNGSRGVQIEGGFIEVTDSLLAGNFRSGGWFDTAESLTLLRNRFTGNGASGLYAKTTRGYYRPTLVQDNVIAGNAHAGISLDRESIGNYAKNTFTGNLGRAIDIGIDGPTVATVPGLPGSGGVAGMPAVISARYEEGQTVIEVMTAPHSVLHLRVIDVVHVYASRVPKDGGELVGTVDRSGSPGERRMTLRVPADLRGQWVSAATLSIYFFNSEDSVSATSETSEPRLVE